MRNPFELLEYRKSYRSGLLMSRAFRILKKRTNDVLAPHDVNATDWGILGVLIDQKKGARLSELADEMGVKAPYITKSIHKLTKRKLVDISADTTDTRVRVATITPEGKRFVKTVEPALMADVKSVFAGINTRDVVGYLNTLIQLVERHREEINESPDLDHMKE